ncbi:MAG: hypothetical protein ACRDQ5_05525 [Sciscionella sp.]
MVVVDPEARTDDVISSAAAALRVEPMLGLEWSRAIELAGGVWVAAGPAGVRRAWIHRAPEEQVLALYRAARADSPSLAAPWWLRALAAGKLASRKGGFAVEDAVAAMLAERPGWVYVPWVSFGEDGYWEFVPSEDSPVTVPTTITLTDRHPGWLDVVPAYSGAPGPTIAIDGALDLAARLPELERSPSR